MRRTPSIVSVVIDPLEQRVGGGLCRGMTVLGLLGHHRAENISECCGRVWPQRFYRGRRLGLVGHQPLSQRPLDKRRAAGEQKEHRATETVDVGPRIDRVAVQRLFGGEVVGRAEHLLIVSDRQ